MKIFIVLYVDSYCGCTDGDCCGMSTTTVDGCFLSRDNAVYHILDRVKHTFDQSAVRKAKRDLETVNYVDFGHCGILDIEVHDCK
jgi:hypothetical protein